MRLLLHREYTLDVVASLCGFSGANYLCRVFKKETGQSPAQWRAMAGQSLRPGLSRRRASASRSSTFKSILFSGSAVRARFFCGVHLVIRLFHGVVDIFKAVSNSVQPTDTRGRMGIPARKCP